MEPMVAGRQDPDTVPLGELAEANGALGPASELGPRGEEEGRHRVSER